VLWTDGEDEQLIGRVARFGQHKQVHVYRLIAEGTPDVFLNNISFGKAQLLKSFVKMSPAMRKFKYDI
jgi:SNF2 family DNA or RNA helicase